MYLSNCCSIVVKKHDHAQLNYGHMFRMPFWSTLKRKGSAICLQICSRPVHCNWFTEYKAWLLITHLQFRRVHSRSPDSIWRISVFVKTHSTSINQSNVQTWPRKRDTFSTSTAQRALSKSTTTRKGCVFSSIVHRVQPHKRKTQSSSTPMFPFAVAIEGSSMQR